MQQNAASPIQARIFTKVISLKYFQSIEVQTVSVSLLLRAVPRVAAPVPSAGPHPEQSLGATGFSKPAAPLPSRNTGAECAGIAFFVSRPWNIADDRSVLPAPEVSTREQQVTKYKVK